MDQEANYTANILRLIVLELVLEIRNVSNF